MTVATHTNCFSVPAPERVSLCAAGIEPYGNCVNAPARFIVETFSAGRGDVEVVVLNPKGQRVPVRRVRARSHAFMIGSEKRSL